MVNSCKNIFIIFLVSSILVACEDEYQIEGLEVRFEPGTGVQYDRFLMGFYEGQVVAIADENGNTVFQVKDNQGKLSRLIITPSQKDLPGDAQIMIGDEVRFSESVAINMTKVNLEGYRNLKRFLQITLNQQIPFVSLVDTRPDKLKEGYQVEYLELEIKEQGAVREPPRLKTKIKLVYELTKEELVIAPKKLKQLATKWNFILIDARQENPNYKSSIRIADGPPPFWFSYILYRDIKKL